MSELSNPVLLGQPGHLAEHKTTMMTKLKKMSASDQPQRPAYGHRRHRAGGAEGQRECSTQPASVTKSADAPTAFLGAGVVDDIGQDALTFSFGTVNTLSA